MAESELNLGEIQGNVLAGFNKDHQSFLFVGFPVGSDPAGWLAALAPDVATCTEALAFNALFKAVRERRGGRERTLAASWMNLALTAPGLQRLGVPPEELGAFPPSFNAGMAAQAQGNGDVGANAPEHWIAPFGTQSVHALVQLAADSARDLAFEELRQVDALVAHGLVLLYAQRGRARTDLPGHEHFGFKDGVSQPNIRGLDPAGPLDADHGADGQPLIWPGEFVLGYPTQRGPTEPAPPIPGPPDYGSSDGGAPPPLASPAASPEPGPPSSAGPAWTADGSFLVFRRLRQDVAAFSAYLEQLVETEGITTALAGAKLLGRYRSGCPLEHTASEPADLDPQLADPSAGDPSLLAEPQVNDFDYDADPDGALVPRAAHIRKVNPRREAAPGGIAADSDSHRLLRRGIAYGAPYDPGAPAGSPHAGEVAYPHDRGLLFLCYQASIERQFEFVQRLWVNNPNFPQSGDGHDPVIAQLADPRAFSVPGLRDPELSVPQFVTTTGGEYFFAPSISALRMLGEGHPVTP
jgi:Dyp-type peroxidase family